MEEGYDMKYIGMPLGIWLFFRKSFQRNLTAVFELTPTEAQAVMVESKGKYKEIIRNLPEFEKGDRFQMNIVGCVMLGALVFSMPLTATRTRGTWSIYLMPMTADTKQGSRNVVSVL